MTFIGRSPDGWIEPRTLLDYKSLPGVVNVIEHDEPGVVTLVVREGCDGLVRILQNSGVTPLGLELREQVAEPMPR